MTSVDRDPVERFAAALDALAQGEPVRLAGDEASLLAAARRLRALDAAQGADPVLADRIWVALMDQAALQGRRPILPAAGAPSPASRNGKSTSHLPPPVSRIPPPASHLPRPRPWLAVAAAVLLAIVGGLMVLRLVAPARQEAVLTAAQPPALETLVDATVDGAAETWTPLAVERWTFQPGDATLTIPPLDGPQWIVAEGSGLVLTVDGTASQLAAGHGVSVAAGHTLTLHNSSSEQTAALRGAAASGFALEDYPRDAIKKQSALDTAAHEALPPGRSRVVFERLTLGTGTSLLLEPASGQDWLTVSSGTLGLTLLGDGLPRPWQSGHEREIAAGEPLPALVPGTRVTLRNLGEEPLVLLRLRLLPATGSNSPTPTTDAGGQSS
jgi:hypothetical protein